MRKSPTPTSKEIVVTEDSFLASKTDLKGIIKYSNREFTRISGYDEKELIGQNHNIVRHPDMPRCIFWLLWNTISKGNEINAYVKNLCKSGEYYWVLANVTASVDADGNIVGYYSVRRKPAASALIKIVPLYKELKAIEERNSNRKEGIQDAMNHLNTMLEQKGVSYDEFIITI